MLQTRQRAKKKKDSKEKMTIKTCKTTTKRHKITIQKCENPGTETIIKTLITQRDVKESQNAEENHRHKTIHKCKENVEVQDDGKEINTAAHFIQKPQEGGLFF